ncbi:MAG: hypothetical protein WCT26_00920 [Candidatus Buchananbacteria bacterium]|jgi:hypothetical protein
MNKKYLSLISLVALAMLAGGLLSGCGLQPTDESAGTVDETPLSTAAVDEQTPVAPEPVVAPVITDAELDQEIKAIDADLETVKTTGFEASNLADKDLGL